MISEASLAVACLAVVLISGTNKTETEVYFMLVNNYKLL